MRVRSLLVLLAAAAMVPGVALAQDIQGGAARGAAAGSDVLGPVGAAVGAAIGGTVGIFEPPPPPVVTYVQGENIPSVTVEKDVVVGEALPPMVVIHPIPHRVHYAYAVVNNERLIVDPETRKVIEIVPED